MKLLNNILSYFKLSTEIFLFQNKLQLVIYTQLSKFPCVFVVDNVYIGNMGASAPYTDQRSKTPWGLVYTCVGKSARFVTGKLCTQFEQRS